jgi:hypothetical protein
MPTTVSFSDSDLLRNKILPPSWYKLRIDSVSEWSPTKAGDSNNCLMECIVLNNADTNETEGIAGVPVTLQFNDKPKARGFIEGFLSSLGVDIAANARYDLQSASGKTIEAFVENETYEGRIRNRVNHKYRKNRS